MDYKSFHVVVTTYHCFYVNSSWTIVLSIVSKEHVVRVLNKPTPFPDSVSVFFLTEDLSFWFYTKTKCNRHPIRYHDNEIAVSAPSKEHKRHERQTSTYSNPYSKVYIRQDKLVRMLTMFPRMVLHLLDT